MGTDIPRVRKAVNYGSIARSETRLGNLGNPKAEDEADGSLVAGNYAVEMESNDSIVIPAVIRNQTRNC